jgi:hypothetical protein
MNIKRLGSGYSISLLIALALAAVPPVASAGEQKEAAPSGPRIEVEAKEIDLGVINKGAVAEATFTIRNGGDQILKITRAKPG